MVEGGSPAGAGEPNVCSGHWADRDTLVAEKCSSLREAPPFVPHLMRLGWRALWTTSRMSFFGILL